MILVTYHDYVSITCTYLHVTPHSWPNQGKYLDILSGNIWLMGFKLGCYTDICIWHLMIDAAEICTRFSTIVTCWLQLISPVRDDETARVLARDECHGWLPLYNLRPPHPPPSSTAQRTEDRSSTCGGLVGMSANWGQSSEFVDIPARFTLCPNLNCVAVILMGHY